MDIQIPECVDWSSATLTRREETLQRPPIPAGNFRQAVAGIIARVGEDGDQAVLELGEKYDGIVPAGLEVSADEWAQAESLVETDVLKAMDEAIARIDAFHSAGKPVPMSQETAPG